GAGTINGNVINRGGIISVGGFATAGTLTINGDFSNSGDDNGQQVGGTLVYAMNALSSGNQLVVTGSLSLGGTLYVFGTYNQAGALPLIVVEGTWTTDPQFQQFAQVSLQLPGTANVEYGDSDVWLVIQ